MVSEELITEGVVSNIQYQFEMKVNMISLALVRFFNNGKFQNLATKLGVQKITDTIVNLLKSGSLVLKLLVILVGYLIVSVIFHYFGSGKMKEKFEKMYLITVTLLKRTFAVLKATPFAKILSVASKHIGKVFMAGGAVAFLMSKDFKANLQNFLTVIAKHPKVLVEKIYATLTLQEKFRLFKGVSKLVIPVMKLGKEIYKIFN